MTWRLAPPTAAPESRRRRLALAPLAPLAALYGLGARLDRLLYESGWRERADLPCPVIAVGSPLVGGTGKTPLTAWLAAALRDRGHRVAVVSRGFGRRSRGRRVVSDGERIQATVEDAGDEPFWLAGQLPGVPVVVAEDRAEAGREAIAAFGCELLVLDDGLQHHRLSHDLSIATLDAATGLGNARILPRGPLREPLAALARADVLATWDGDLSPADARRVSAAAPSLRPLAVRRRALGVRALGEDRLHPPQVLAGLGVGLLSGLANPASLRRSVELLGARVVAERRFPDHHRYRARDLRGLARQAAVWVTSEKDAVKLQPAWARQLDVRVLASALEVDQPGPFLDWLERELARRAGARAGPHLVGRSC